MKEIVTINNFPIYKFYSITRVVHNFQRSKWPEIES